MHDQRRAPMYLLNPVRVILSVVALSAILAGCGGSSPSPVQVEPGVSLGSGDGGSLHRQKSWMLPGAKTQSLLYVSNQGNGSVTAYTYVNGGGLVLVGTLTGFSKPTGMCTDNAGNVWIPDYGTRLISEYAHGGTTPIFTIKEHIGLPFDC